MKNLDLTKHEVELLIDAADMYMEMEHDVDISLSDEWKRIKQKLKSYQKEMG